MRKGGTISMYDTVTDRQRKAKDKTLFKSPSHQNMQPCHWILTKQYGMMSRKNITHLMSPNDKKLLHDLPLYQ